MVKNNTKGNKEVWGKKPKKMRKIWRGNWCTKCCMSSFGVVDGGYRKN